MQVAVVALIAGLLTLFDLDRQFYVPARTPQKARLYAWWWSFVLGNAALAVLVYLIVQDAEMFRNLNPWLKASLIGTGYQALMRSKLTTVRWHGDDVPVGPELFYEGAKHFVLKRINAIAKLARRQETERLAGTETLSKLAQRARLSINQDALLSAEEKASALSWVQQVEAEGAAVADNFDQRAALANYILSGQR